MGNRRYGYLGRQDLPPRQVPFTTPPPRITAPLTQEAPEVERAAVGGELALGTIAAPGKLQAGTTNFAGQPLDSFIAQLRHGIVVGLIASKGGQVDLRGYATYDVANWKVVYSTIAMPSDATLNASTAVSGQLISLPNVATLALDGVLYVKWRVFHTSGTAGEIQDQVIRRDTKNTTKTWTVSGANINPISNAQDYRSVTDAFSLGGGTYPLDDIYAFTPNGAGTKTVVGVVGVPLPPGTILTAMRVQGSAGTTPSVCEVKLQRMANSGVLNATLATVNAGGNATLNETISSTYDYLLWCRVANGAGRPDLDALLVRIELDYDTPDYEKAR